MKTFYVNAIHEWMMYNPGIRLTIYDVGSYFNRSYIKSMTFNNITSGFKKSGIYPINSDIFSSEDFLPTYIFDSIVPTNDETQNQNPSTSSAEINQNSERPPYPDESNILSNRFSELKDYPKRSPVTGQGGKY